MSETLTRSAAEEIIVALKGENPEVTPTETVIDRMVAHGIDAEHLREQFKDQCASALLAAANNGGGIELKRIPAEDLLSNPAVLLARVKRGLKNNHPKKVYASKVLEALEKSYGYSFPPERKQSLKKRSAATFIQQLEQEIGRMNGESQLLPSSLESKMQLHGGLAEQADSDADLEFDLMFSQENANMTQDISLQPLDETVAPVSLPVSEPKLVQSVAPAKTAHSAAEKPQKKSMFSFLKRKKK